MANTPIAAVALGALLLFSTAPAYAETTLLNLVNTFSPDAFFAAEFTATGTTTTLYVGGYDLFAASLTRINNVQSISGGPNLLKTNWSYMPAASGSLAMQESSMSGVNDLVFSGKSVGSYDTFFQSFTTTPGFQYSYSFLYDASGVDDGLRASIDGVPNAVPEPSVWAMMLLGFGCLGLLAYRKSRASDAADLLAA